MNAVEIEEAISALAEQPFDSVEFPFAFLQAFGNKDTTLKRLRSGASNKSDIGGVLQTNNIHIAVAAPGEVTKSGADPIEARPGFAALLARIAGNGVRTIIVETANRFARDLMVQEVGFAMLRDLGVTLIAADSPSSFLDDGPTSKLIRQILGAVSEFDKAMTVAKLKGARDRVRRARGKCEGRKAYAEREGGQELVALARQLRGNPDGRPQSLRKIAAESGPRGYVTPSGRHYSASAVASMLGEA